MRYRLKKAYRPFRRLYKSRLLYNSEYPTALHNYLSQNHINLGLNIKTEGVLSVEEVNHNEFTKIYQVDKDKNIPINVYNSNLMDGFLRGIINPLISSGVDLLWVDDNNKDNTLRDFTMNYYLSKNLGMTSARRNLVFSRNFGIAPHKYSILYSGKTNISWKTLRFLPFFNANASNIGVSWWSHDIGG